MENIDTEKILDSFHKKEIEKLTSVGFTEEQAKVLIEMMKNKALGGGFF